MKQIQCAAAGPTHLTANCVEVEDVGAPGAWEVVVDLELFPINQSDLNLAEERFAAGYTGQAISLGAEALGRVVRIGSSVQGLAVGDLVVMLTNSHNWSERRKLTASAVHKISESGDLLQLAQLKTAPVAAHLLLDLVPGLMEGDWLIQSAPLTSIGRCVLQMAHSRGIRTISIVDAQAHSTSLLEWQTELIHQLGGSIVLSDGPELESRIVSASGGQLIAIALDALGGRLPLRLSSCLKPGGRLVRYRNSAVDNDEPGQAPSQVQEQLEPFGIRYEEFEWTKRFSGLSAADRSSLLNQLARKIVRGQLRLDVDSVYPLHEVRAALVRAQQPDCNGKVILTTNKDIA